MDLLLADTLDPEVTAWLESRHEVRRAPELASRPRDLKRAMFGVRAVIVPASLKVDAELIEHAPILQAIGCVGDGFESIDLQACGRNSIEVVFAETASARSQAEFAIGAVLTMLHRVPVRGGDGVVGGRELGEATVGLLGMPASARNFVKLVAGFGPRVIGYEPTVHADDPAWGAWRVAPVGLRELVERADALCVMLDYFTRYQGLLGEGILPHCKQDQVVVCTSNAALFDERALAEALKSGRIAAAWLDDVVPERLHPGRPLHGIDSLQVTVKQSRSTREARLRSAWSVARRIDAVLEVEPLQDRGFRSTVPGALSARASGPPPP